MNQHLFHRAVLVALTVLCCSAVTPSRAADEKDKKPAPPDSLHLTQEQLDNMYMQAVMLHKYGRYDEAEAIAKRLQAQLPDNRDVKQLLAEITRARERLGEKRAGGELQRKLAQMTVPEINFRDAVVQDVVTFLREESAKHSTDKKAINFVWLIPGDTKLPPVSLSLKQIPMLDVLQYVTQLAGLRYRIDAHAVVIYKESPPAAPQPAPGDAPEPNVKPQ